MRERERKVRYTGYFPATRILYFWGAPKSLQMMIVAMKLKDAYSLEGKL